MFYGYLANVIVAIHIGYVSFVVLGLVAILVGMVCRWEWVRNRWFRCIHLGMIGFVAFESVIDMRCPLTVWEEDLRVAAGQEVIPDNATFMGRLLFYQWPMWVFNSLYIGFALLVLSTFVFAPVRWRRVKGLSQRMKDEG